MKKIVFICPYFGNLPKNSFNLWLQSCAMNPTIDWIIFTDDKTNFDYPSNVKVVYYEFEDIKKIIQSKFDFKISLKKPYKLCDYKPTYGYIFSDYIKDYDFWGHCDISDCIFGNIRKFLNDEILSSSEKIGFLGHMTLYKNTNEINCRFMLKVNNNKSIKEILGAEDNQAFDELTPYSINSIYKKYDFPIYRIDDMYVDISPLRFSFQASYYDDKYVRGLKKKKPMIFEWKDGILYEYTVDDKVIHKREIGYVHFQKRKMIREFEVNENNYYIIPNKFVSNFEKNDINKLQKVSRDKLYNMYFKLKWAALKYHVTKILKR